MNIPTKYGIGRSIMVIIFSSVVLFGSFGLKVYDHLGDTGFASVVSAVCLVVLVSVFIGPIESFTLGVSGLKAKIRKIEQTEVSVREVAKALLDVIETSQDQMYVCKGHDQEAADKAKEKLKQLIT